jgi:hypothetical protein
VLPAVHEAVETTRLVEVVPLPLAAGMSPLGKAVLGPGVHVTLPLTLAAAGTLTLNAANPVSWPRCAAAVPGVPLITGVPRALAKSGSIGLSPKSAAVCGEAPVIVTGALRLTPFA